MQFSVLKAPHTLFDLSADEVNAILERSPMVSSSKIDGNRILITPEGFITPSGKYPRNEYLRSIFGDLLDHSETESLCLDCEFFDPAQSHHASSSGALNAFEGEIPSTLKAFVFDAVNYSDWQQGISETPFSERLMWAEEAVTTLNKAGFDRCELLPQRPVTSLQDIMTYYSQDIANNFEGSIVRTTSIWYEGAHIRGGFYKKQRATRPQKCIWKLKPFDPLDGVIVRVYPRRRIRADWPREYRDGYLVQPGAKAAFEDVASLGALDIVFRDENNAIQVTGVGFREGFDLLQREQLWSQYLEDPFTLIGQWVSVKSLQHGAKEEGKLRAGGLHAFRYDLTGQDPSLETHARDLWESTDRELWRNRHGIST